MDRSPSNESREGITNKDDENGGDDSDFRTRGRSCSQVYQTYVNRESNDVVDVAWDWNSPKRLSNKNATNNNNNSSSRCYGNRPYGNNNKYNNNNNNKQSPKPLIKRPIKRNLSNNQLEAFKRFQLELLELRDQISKDDTIELSPQCDIIDEENFLTDFEDDVMLSNFDIDECINSSNNNNSKEVVNDRLATTCQSNVVDKEEDDDDLDDGLDDLFATIDIPVVINNDSDNKTQSDNLINSRHIIDDNKRINVISLDVQTSTTTTPTTVTQTTNVKNASVVVMEESRSMKLTNDLKAKIERNRLEALKRLQMNRQRKNLFK